MLYQDRQANIGPKVEADPFKIESLIAWLERWPTSAQYWFLSENCLLVQYFRACGFTEVSVGGSAWSSAQRGRQNISKEFRTVALPQFRLRTFGFSDTFGAALERARAAQRGDGS